MRPLPYGSGKGGSSARVAARLRPCFNEAAPLRKRKVAMLEAVNYGDYRFNEAAPLRKRKGRQRDRGEPIRIGFNEAAPLRKRKECPS